jgi:hypothetical protein
MTRRKRRSFAPKLVNVGQLFTGDHIRDAEGCEFIVVRLTPRCLYVRKPDGTDVMRSSVGHGAKIELLN